MLFPQLLEVHLSLSIQTLPPMHPTHTQRQTRDQSDRLGKVGCGKPFMTETAASPMSAV